MPASVTKTQEQGEDSLFIAMGFNTEVFFSISEGHVQNQLQQKMKSRLRSLRA
jgi:hypothetical protein